MGLGRLSLGQVLPALVQAGNAKPVALISGDVEKRDLVAAQYGIPLALGYEDVAQLADHPEVEAVYIATPNGLHLEHVRAVVAGDDGRSIKTIAFRQAESLLGQALLGAGPHRRLWIAGRARIDDFNGGTRAELHLDDAAWAD